MHFWRPDNVLCQTWSASRRSLLEVRMQSSGSRVSLWSLSLSRAGCATRLARETKLSSSQLLRHSVMGAASMGLCSISVAVRCCRHTAAANIQLRDPAYIVEADFATIVFASAVGICRQILAVFTSEATAVTAAAGPVRPP